MSDLTKVLKTRDYLRAENPRHGIPISVLSTLLDGTPIKVMPVLNTSASQGPDIFLVGDVLAALDDYLAPRQWSPDGLSPLAVLSEIRDGFQRSALANPGKQISVQSVLGILTAVDDPSPSASRTLKAMADCEGKIHLSAVVRVLSDVIQQVKGSHG